VHAFTLLRRLVFRSVPSGGIVPDPTRQIWDVLSRSAQDAIQETLLEALQNLPTSGRGEDERNMLCLTVAQVETACERRGREFKFVIYLENFNHVLNSSNCLVGSISSDSWSALVNFLSSAATTESPFALRDAAFRIHSECPTILQDLEPSVAVSVLIKGLQDEESPGVRNCLFLDHILQA
jgi:hypothetical protein